jgi:hypothetical protein
MSPPIRSLLCVSRSPFLACRERTPSPQEH